MGDLITRLTNLFNLSKTVAVTVPGLIAAAALGLVLRPVSPKNEIAVPIQGAECEFRQEELTPPAHLSFGDYRDTARAHQNKLEVSRLTLQDCILQRTSELGKEEADIADKKIEIEVQSKERDVFARKYLQYVESLGPLRANYESGMRTRTDQIMRIRKQLLDDELAAKRRQLAIDRLKASLKVVDERLADPGRLRPALGFADYFEGLTSKVLAFVLLAMALGFTLDPINRGLFGALFDVPFVLSSLNWLRSGRFEVIR